MVAVDLSDLEDDWFTLTQKQEDFSEENPRSFPTDGFNVPSATLPISHDAPLTDSGYASCYHAGNASASPSIMQKSYIPECMTVAGEAEDDCRTIYSENDGLSEIHKRSCIFEICQVVKDQLGLNICQDSWASTKEILPELIKAFAIRLGLESRNQVNRDIMAFVHKHQM